MRNTEGGRGSKSVGLQAAKPCRMSLTHGNVSAARHRNIIWSSRGTPPSYLKVPRELHVVNPTHPGGSV